MKNVCFFIAALFAVLFMSCSEDYDFGQEKESAPSGRSALISRSTSNAGIAYFDSVCAPDNWVRYQSLAEMEEALDLPDYILNSLSTAELVECCANYPLWINYTAYNDPEIGILNVIENFNGFSELKNREDYADELMDYYIMNRDKSLYSRALSSVGGLDFKDKFKTEFVHAVIKSGYYSDLMAPKYAYILDRESNNAIRANAASSDDIVIFHTGRSLFGWKIELLELPELSSAEIEAYNNEWKTRYPNAEYLGSSTRSYNCHFYAWAMKHGSNERYWLNYLKSDNSDNVSLYWDRDEYCSSNSSDYVNVYYSTGDHSAKKSSVAGKLESKWGAGPLMRHAPGYCPYKSDKLRYFKRFKAYGILTTSYGIGETSVGVKEYYYISDSSVPTVRMTWKYHIENAKGDDAIELGYAIVHWQDGPNILVEFTKLGIYNVAIDGYNYEHKLVCNYCFEALLR